MTMLNRLLLFAVACLLGGFGGAFGSILGNAAGKTGLLVGGVIGGLIAALLVGPIARWRGWIRPDRARATALGAAIGFLAAALIATRTLGSPVGPVLSTALIGIGALLGAGPRPPGPAVP
jgi:phosphotransferase system  glucose/maltose/N-acetylglucosamine-specific IIC component